mgnify:CR=1 FL=1
MEVQYERKRLADFEMNILAKGEHGVFLKQSFSVVGDTIYSFIDDAGFRKVAAEDLDTPLKLLGVLEKLCLNLRRAENYMFDLRKLELSMNLLYINDDMEVALKYQMASNEENIDKKICRLLNEIPLNSTACTDYLNIFKGNLDKNYSVAKLVSVAGELKREAYYCGYN